MKTLLNGLLLALLTTIMLSFLNGPISRWASGDRLIATIELSPFIAKPEAAPENKRPKSDADTADSALQEQLSNILSAAKSNTVMDGSYDVAHIVLRNESNITIKEINFYLDPPYDEMDIALSIAGKTSEIKKGVKRIYVPDMKPGDAVEIYAWRNFYAPSFGENLHTFSSAGPWRTSIAWPKTRQEMQDGVIFNFIDNWITTIMFVMFAAVLFVAFLAYAMSEHYWKSLLHNETFFLDEKIRYDNDRNKFKPDYNKPVI